jgi:N-methylhydantoinase A/oxoprolinase/acetone carboxylase beta subunit
MRLDLRVGMDVGGTNTDAVVLDENNRILARTKQATTSDVRSGMQNALTYVIDALGADAQRIGRVMLGTTHATNAILERRSLGRVAAIRLGAPASLSLEPMGSWPDDLRDAVCVDACILEGGHYVDGRRISPLDEDGIRKFLSSVANTVDAIAITSIFSPTSPHDEERAREIVSEVLGSNMAVTLSHEIGSLGLL